MGTLFNYTDEELTAYLDGELPTDKTAEIDAALKNDEALCSQLEVLSIDKEKMKKAFASLLDEAPSTPPIIIPEARWNVKQMAAAAVVALTVGLGAGTFIPEKKNESWTGYVAAYQALYANATLAHVDQTEDTAKAELARVSAAIGKNFDYQIFAKDQNLEYKRSQILNFNGKPLIQIAFVTDDGQPIALCIIQKTGSQDAQMALDEAEGLKTASWTNNGYGYLIIGGKDEGLIKEAASYYSAQL